MREAGAMEGEVVREVKKGNSMRSIRPINRNERNVISKQLHFHLLFSPNTPISNFNQSIQLHNCNKLIGSYLLFSH